VVGYFFYTGDGEVEIEVCFSFFTFFLKTTSLLYLPARSFRLFASCEQIRACALKDKFRFKMYGDVFRSCFFPTKCLTAVHDFPGGGLSHTHGWTTGAVCRYRDSEAERPEKQNDQIAEQVRVR